jgi:hypothetical protein
MSIGSIIAAAGLALALSIAPAHAIEVHKTGMAKGVVADVWGKIGGFCAINDWHPAVESCVESHENGETFRTLTLPDGGMIKERLIEQTDTSYTYEIVESPLPVENYRSTFRVMDHGEEAMVEWQGSFDAKGVSDDEAEDVISGIYQAGLEQIGRMGE